MNDRASTRSMHSTRSFLLLMMAALLAVLLAGAASLASPQKAEAYTAYPTWDELTLDFNAVSSQGLTYRQYYYGTAYDGLQGDTVPAPDPSRLGGISYDESTGTLTIAGEGADDYVWWASYANRYMHFDLTGSLEGIYVKTADPDRQLYLTIVFEADTRLSDNDLHTYTASLWAKIPEVSAVIENPTGGTTTLTSSNGSRVEILRTWQNNNDVGGIPFAGIYSEGPVVISGNIDLDVSCSNPRSTANQPACGIWANSLVMITQNAAVDISAGSWNSTLDSTCATAAIRCNSTVFPEPFEVFTDHAVALSAKNSKAGNESRAAAIYDANSTNSLSWRLSETSGAGTSPRVECLYYGGSFGLTGNNTAVNAGQKTGYSLSDVKDEDGVKTGVLYRANSGHNLDRAIVKIPIPQLGKKNADRTITSIITGITANSDAATWSYRKSASGQWTTLYENTLLPLDTYEVKVRYTVQTEDNYFFLDSLKGGYQGEGKVGDPVELQNGAAPNTATFERIIPKSKLRAPELVNQIDITGVTLPLPGAKPTNPVDIRSADSLYTYDQNRIPSGVNYSWAYFRPEAEVPSGTIYQYREYWTVKGSSTPLWKSSDTFQPGVTYQYHAAFRIKDDNNTNYAFAGYPYGGATAATVNGSSEGSSVSTNAATVGGYTPGTIAFVTYEYTCPNYTLDTVKVTGLTMPVKGATPNADGKVVSGSPYTISTQNWYYGTVGAVQPINSTFQEAEWYVWDAYIKPTDGFSFPDGEPYTSAKNDVSVTVNGDTADWVYYAEEDSGHPGEIHVRTRFLTPAGNTISRIDLTTDDFGVGLTPGTTVSTETEGVAFSKLGFNYPEGMAAVMARSAFWMEGGESALNDAYRVASETNPVTLASSFAAGDVYTFYAVVQLEDAYFDYDECGSFHTEVYINGYPATFTWPVPEWGKNPYYNSHVGVVSLTTLIPDSSSPHLLWVPQGCKVFAGGLALSESNDSVMGVLNGSHSYVAYEIDPTKTYAVRKGNWEAPRYQAFWKWEKLRGNIDIAYPMKESFTFKGSDVTEDISVRIQTAHYLYVPNDFSSSNKAVSVNGWDSNLNSETTTYPFSNSMAQVDYTGSALLPYPHEIVDNNATPDDISDDYVLEEGRDYTVAYLDPDGNPITAPTDAGKYTIVLTGIGNYDGTRTQTFSITPRSISDATVTFQMSYDYSQTPAKPWVYYTDAAQTPAFTVTYGGKTLTKGVDYEIASWQNNTGVGTNPNVRINGIGNFKASRYDYFEIRARNIESASIAPIEDVTFNWDDQKLEPVVTFGDETLVKNTHYRLDYKGDTMSAGTVTVTVTGISYNGWTGERTVTYNINQVDINSDDVTFTINPQAYTGSVISPYVSSSYLGHNVSFHKTSTANSKFPGTGTVTVEGDGNFVGTREVNFEIYADLGWDVQYSGVESSYTWTGSQIKPEPTATIGGQALVKDKDYTIEYGENTNVGGNAGTITVKPKDTVHYTSQKTLYFDIVKADIASTTISIPAQTYTGSAIEPLPTITYGGRTLELDTDYEITGYENNVEVGLASVNISGKGGFEGTTTATFQIVKPHTVKWDRIYGAIAADTMQKIAAKFGKSNYAIVTTDASFKDALAASSLAGHYKAPVLMTKKGSLTAQTKKALQACGAKTVFIVGTTSDVSTATQNAIKKVPGVKNVWRVNGSSASVKAVNVAKKTGTKSDTVIIVTQNDYRDALTIAPYAYATESPILYTETNKKLSAATTGYIKSRGFKKAIIVGGPLALPDSVDMQLRKAGVKQANITRIAGGTAYVTSKNIALWTTGNLANGNYGTYKGKTLQYIKFQPAVKMGVDNLCISTGQNWLDALAGAALCGKNKTVMLLADSKTSKSNYTNATAFCKKYKDQINNAWVLGGPKAVQDKVYEALKASTAPAFTL